MQAARPPRASSGAIRPVRSYVLRQGRVTRAQARALATLYPRYGVPFRDALLEWRELFGRIAPVYLEIGSGMGETIAALAAANPDHDYLAVEVHGPGVGSLLARIAARALTNLRVIRHDAVDVLERMVPPASLAGIYVFFPDPWPKKRHHKRRLVNARFAALAASRLAPGAVLHLATDWPPYAQAMLAVLGGEPRLENTALGYAPRPPWRPETRFERRGVALGHEVRDLVFRRRQE